MEGSHPIQSDVQGKTDGTLTDSTLCPSPCQKLPQKLTWGWQKLSPILGGMTQSWSSVITILYITFLRQASSEANRETSGSADP